MKPSQENPVRSSTKQGSFLGVSILGAIVVWGSILGSFRLSELPYSLLFTGLLGISCLFGVGQGVDSRLEVKGLQDVGVV